MRVLAFCLFLLLPLSRAFAAPAPETAAATPEAPASAERKWLQPEAEFRLTAVPERPAEASSIDLRRLVLPVLPSNGVRVFDDAGNPVAYQLHDNFSLSIAPAPKAKSFDIYFGYSARQPFDTWTKESGERPPAQRLKLNFYWGGNRPCTPQEFLDRRNMEIARAGVNRWHTRNFYNRPFVLMRQAITGFEVPRGVPKFPQYFKNRQNLFKRLHTKNKNLWLRTASELNGYPYCERMRRFNASLKNQMKNHLEYMKREIARIDGQYAQARKEMEHGAENDLLSVAGWRNPREFIATEVQLVVRPPETSEHYSARFSGFLDVPEDGEYEFELRSNSLTLLRLDGQVVARRLNANGSQPAETVVVRQSLKKGSIPFELFYRLNSGYSQMTARMRPAGKGEFRLLAAEHFTPARPATPTGLVSSRNVEYPLLSRRGHYLLYTAKQSYIPIESFDFLTPAEELEWQFGDSEEWRSPDELSIAVIPGNTPETALSFRRIDRPETRLTVLNPDYRADLVELRPDLQLRLWAPEIIYDDEELPVAAETISRLPLEIEAQLDISVDGRALELRRVRLPAKPDERFNRAAADIYRKDTITLPPQRQKKAEFFRVRLDIENFEFDRAGIRILPVMAENLAQQANLDNTVLVLHRPKLSDIRNWELPRKIGDELAPFRKLLLIAEPVEGLAAFAEEQLKTRENQTLEFVPFRDSETPLRDGFLELLDRIGNSTADRAILFLPCLHHMGTIEPWMRDRYIAAILEKLRRNRKLHAVYLVPAPVRPGEEKSQEELQEALRRLAREYDVPLLEPATGQPPTGPEHPFHTPEEFLPLLKTLHDKL
ncbi:PA14 domain-containing protein [uncultured Victivallis sp.]|uniref:PA14 domain-containing protein n=1 Tax=uncultured Victivallis sp. TaxID=354118 RepID=UPI0025D0D229|nr:PA14 domain-containing protein [uncultured Victivallis sp.]